MSDPFFRPGDPSFRASPYEDYARLRKADPVHHVDDGFWVVTRYADVSRCLQDRLFGMADFWATQAARFGAGPALGLSTTWMLFKDPPDHTRLRRLVSRAFSPRAVERLRPRIATIVDELLAGGTVEGVLDVVRDLAFPLPIHVIAELLGVPASERDRFHAWTQAMNLAFEPSLDESAIARCNAACGALADYFAALVQRRRGAPGDDLVSAMLAAEEDGQRLSEAEVIGNAALLLSAGYETTMGMIGNGSLALCENRGELRRLADDPALIPNAIEEFLRYDSPVQYTVRFALGDVELGGKRIRAGEPLYLIVASANRDGDRFPNPDALDVGRADVEHLSFGGGRHFCIGAFLARIEGEIAFSALVPLLARADLASEARPWRASYLNHALESLPIRLAG